MPGDQTRMAEIPLLGHSCVVCDSPIIEGHCLCGTHTSTGIVAVDPITADDVVANLEDLRRRLPGDQLARVVRRSRNEADPCESGHQGPWTIVSRHKAPVPHKQCGACGAIDRTGEFE